MENDIDITEQEAREAEAEKNKNIKRQKAIETIRMAYEELESENRQKAKAIKALKKKDRKQFWLGVLSGVLSSGIIALLGWIISIIF